MRARAGKKRLAPSLSEAQKLVEAYLGADGVALLARHLVGPWRDVEHMELTWSSNDMCHCSPIEFAWLMTGAFKRRANLDSEAEVSRTLNSMPTEFVELEEWLLGKV